MFKYTKIFVAILLMLIGGYAHAQTSNFSQYHLNPVYHSPGDLAISDYLQVTTQYRKQSLSADQGFRNMAVAASYPLYYKGGRKMGAMGLGVMNETSGALGMQKESSIRAAYAYSLQMKRTHFLSIGMQGGYYRRSIDASKVNTDEQYNNGIFMPGLPTGESFADYASQSFKVDAGITWYALDEFSEQKFSLGMAAFNVNKANYSFLENSRDQSEPMRFLAHGSVRALQGDRFQVVPTFRFMHEKSYNQLNLGSLFLYQLQGIGGAMHESHLGFGAWYSVGKAAIISMQLTQPRYQISISYDLPAAGKVEYVQVNNAVEVTMGWRLNKSKKIRGGEATVSMRNSTAPVEANPVAEKIEAAPARFSAEVEVEKEPVVVVPAVVEPVNRPLTLEEKEILNQKVVFKEIGSSKLSAASKSELNQIAKLMKLHPALKLKILGHTCKLGTERANQSLSQERADVAKKYIVAQGVAANRIETEGRHYLEPIASNATEEGRQKNRRVEFIILE